MSLPIREDKSGRCEESRDRTHGRLVSYLMPPSFYGTILLNDDHDGHSTQPADYKMEVIDHIYQKIASTHASHWPNTEERNHLQEKEYDYSQKTTQDLSLSYTTKTPKGQQQPIPIQDSHAFAMHRSNI